MLKRHSFYISHFAENKITSVINKKRENSFSAGCSIKAWTIQLPKLIEKIKMLMLWNSNIGILYCFKTDIYIGSLCILSNIEKFHSSMANKNLTSDSSVYHLYSEIINDLIVDQTDNNYTKY